MVWQRHHRCPCWYYRHDEGCRLFIQASEEVAEQDMRKSGDRRSRLESLRGPHR